MSKKRHLCRCPCLKQGLSKETSCHCVAFLSHIVFAFCVLRGSSVSVCVCKHLEMRLLLRMFCFVLTNKICISWMLFGAALINTNACFYEKSLKRRLVSLSQIISKAGGVIDCGSDGERKSGRPDITMLLPVFHLSLIYQNILMKNCFRKHAEYFPAGFYPYFLINV